MKRFLKRIGIIVAVIVGIILVLFVIFCVTHPNETKQVPEGNATNHLPRLHRHLSLKP